MPNRLIHETSPYLRQHAHNPVDWYAWGPEALALARERDRPIHLSVGYAACHWCHVMAHESFEDPDVAQFLNEHFVNIKVDRQERPDIDEVYQKVVQMMGQGGGWPLTVFLTPEGEPFFGGTYFPPVDGPGRLSFMRLLRGLCDAWQHAREQLRSNVERFKRGYRLLDEQHFGAELPELEDVAATAARRFAEFTDPVHGGLGHAPKFPNPSAYDLMLRVHQRTREPALLDALTVTLDRMAHGGIYDHLGGGFARYSVDERWDVPHFEKMLYDQGQLVKLYADAYRATGNPRWRRVFEETIEYVLRDLTDPAGGFYSSEDADSEGEEGRFYVWTPAQLRRVLGEDDGAFACRVFGVTERGNFEHGTTVLHRAVELDTLEQTRLGSLRERLREARAQRVRPARDENVLTGWNGLMIQGLVAAYQATGTEAYLAAARRGVDFIRERMVSGTGLLRVYRDGVAKIPAFLDDYAFTIHAAIDLYESSFEKRDLDWAIDLMDRVLDGFWDSGLYYSSKDAEQLVHRTRSAYDHACPSGMSSGLLALLRLHEMTGTKPYLERAESLIETYAGAAAEDPFASAHFLSGADFARSGATQIVFAGDERELVALVQAVHRSYQPLRIMALADHVEMGRGRAVLEGRPSVFICRKNTCSLPVSDVEALRRYGVA